MKFYSIHQMDLARRDGIVFHIVELAAGIKACGIPVEVVAPLRSRRDVDFPVPIRYLPMPARPKLLGIVVFELSLLWYLLTRRAVWRRQAVLYLRRGTLLLAPLLVGRLFGLPTVLEENGLVAYGSGRGEQVGLAWLSRLLLRLQFAAATHIVAVSQGARRNVAVSAPGAVAKVAVIPNGVNTDLYFPQDAAACRRRLNLAGDGDRRYLCFVGSFYKNRGVEYLLRALPYILKEFPKTTLLLVGDTGKNKALPLLAEELGVTSQVVFTGFQPYDKLPDHIGAADICVAPYMSVYGPQDSLSPLKLYAYMACGRAVVMTDVPVEIDTDERSRAIVTVQTDNAEALAEGILGLLRDPVRMAALGQEGRQIAQRYSWHITAARVLAFVRSGSRAENAP